jgi:hypothetical protein
MGAVLLAAATVVGGATVGAGTASACTAADLGLECASDGFSAVETVENIDVRQEWNGTIDKLGAPTRITTYFSVNGDPERALTKITHFAPQGLVFKKAELSFEQAIGSDNGPSVELTGAVDTLRGAVAFTAPAEGWSFPDLGNRRGWIRLDVDYTVLRRNAGDIGVTFAATGISETKEWLARGTFTPNLTIPSPAGSSDIDPGLGFGSLGAAQN